MSTIPAFKKAKQLIFDSDTGGAQTPLSATWKESTITAVGNYRRCMLHVHYSANASSSVNQCQMIVLIANEATAPAIGDDTWVVVSRADDTTADAVVTGTLPTGMDFTVAPLFDVHTQRPVVFQPQVMTAATQKQREPIIINVECASHIVVIAKELGDTTNIGVLKIWASFSA